MSSHDDGIRTQRNAKIIQSTNLRTSNQLVSLFDYFKEQSKEILDDKRVNYEHTGILAQVIHVSFDCRIVSEDLFRTLNNNYRVNLLDQDQIDLSLLYKKAAIIKAGKTYGLCPGNQGAMQTILAIVAFLSGVLTILSILMQTISDVFCILSLAALIVFTALMLASRKRTMAELYNRIEKELLEIAATKEATHKYNTFWELVNYSNAIISKYDINIFQNYDRFHTLYKTAIEHYFREARDISQINVLFVRQFMDIDRGCFRKKDLILEELSNKEKIRHYLSQKKKIGESNMPPWNEIKKLGIDVIIDPQYYNPRIRDTECDNLDDEFSSLAKKLNNLFENDYYQCNILNCAYYLIYFMNTFNCPLSIDEIILLMKKHHPSLQALEKEFAKTLCITTKSKLPELIVKLLELLSNQIVEQRSFGIKRFLINNDLLIYLNNNFIGELPSEHTLNKWILIKALSMEKRLVNEDVLYICARLLREIRQSLILDEDAEYIQLAIETLKTMETYNNYYHHVEIVSELLPIFETSRSEIQLYLKNSTLKETIDKLIWLAPPLPDFYDDEQTLTLKQIDDTYWQLHQRFVAIMANSNSKQIDKRIPISFSILSMDQQRKIQYYNDLLSIRDEKTLEFYRNLYDLYESAVANAFDISVNWHLLGIEKRLINLHFYYNLLNFAKLARLSVDISDQNCLLYEFVISFERVVKRILIDYANISDETIEQILLLNLMARNFNFPLYHMFSTILLNSIDNDDYEPNLNASYQLIIGFAHCMSHGTNTLALMHLIQTIMRASFDKQVSCEIISALVIHPIQYHPIAKQFLNQNIEYVYEICKKDIGRINKIDSLHEGYYIFYLLNSKIQSDDLTHFYYQFAVKLFSKHKGFDIISICHSFLQDYNSLEEKIIKDVLPSIMQFGNLGVLVLARYLLHRSWDFDIVSQYSDIISDCSYLVKIILLGRYILDARFQEDIEFVRKYMLHVLGSATQEAELLIAIDVLKKYKSDLHQYNELLYYKLNEIYLLHERAYQRMFVTFDIAIRYNLHLAQWTLGLSEQVKKADDDMKLAELQPTIRYEYIVNHFSVLSATTVDLQVNRIYYEMLVILVEEAFFIQNQIIERYGKDHSLSIVYKNSCLLINFLLTNCHNKLSQEVIDELQHSLQIITTIKPMHSSDVNSMASFEVDIAL